MPCGLSVADKFRRRVFYTHLGCLLFFACAGTLVGATTIPVNPVQRRWQIISFAWEIVFFGLPLLYWQPLVRRIQPFIHRLEAGETLSDDEVAEYHRRLLGFPLRAGIGLWFIGVSTYVWAGAQLRYFAQMPWEGVIILMSTGVILGLLWAVMAYFILDNISRPLTALCPPSGEEDHRSRRGSLAVKIFTCSFSLVLASLGLFGMTGFSRAAEIVEGEVADSVMIRVRELALLISELPHAEEGSISDAWHFLATEFRISPRGYFHLTDANGRIGATYPGVSRMGMAWLQEELILPELQEQILIDMEGAAIDRVDFPKFVVWADVPDGPWKLVGIAPREDFSSRLDYFLYMGLASMGFAVAALARYRPARGAIGDGAARPGDGCRAGRRGEPRPEPTRGVRDERRGGAARERVQQDGRGAAELRRRSGGARSSSERKSSLRAPTSSRRRATR